MSDIDGSYDNQEVVRLLRSWQHALEEHFVLTIPNAWLGTLKNAVDHCQLTVRVEASGTIEAHMTHDLRPRPNVAIDGNTGGVEIRCARKPLRIIFIPPKTATP